MVKSNTLPGLERNPGGPDNWVEATGGLPKYIERIAKHLHYERGMSIQHAIATAVNTVKRWARKGGVVKYGDPNNMHVTTVTAAQAAKAVAEWESKKARARAGAGSGRRGRISLSEVDVQALVERAKQIKNPEHRASALLSVIDLAFPASPTKKVRKVLASEGKAMPNKESGGSFPIRDVADLRRAIKAFGRAKDKPAAKRHIIKRARALGATNLLPETWDLSVAGGGASVIDLALTKDGRKSFKNRGKWKHGFVPVDDAAKEAKAKGSPIARRRINRLFSGGRKVSDDPRSRSASQTKEIAKARAAKGAKSGTAIRALPRGSGSAERVQDVGQATRADVRDSERQHRQIQAFKGEVGRGRRAPARATQSWDSIPESEKTVRNGKKYVLTHFRGQQLLTEWVGDQSIADAPGVEDRRLNTIQQSKANAFTAPQLRKLLKQQPPLPKEVRKKLRKALKAKEDSERKRA